MGTKMYLVRGTEALLVDGLPKPGFPILLWEDMRGCYPANEFLRYYLQRGAIGSPKSWAPIGQAIYDFFSVLEANGLKWDDVDRGKHTDLVSAYRDYCFNVAKHKRGTVRQRLIFITAFYEYAKRQHWIHKLPFEYEQRRANRKPLSAPSGNMAVASPMPRGQRDLIRFLSTEEVRALLKAVVNPHHRMIVLLALHTGLRREELATFPLSYVFDPAQTPTKSRNIAITLDPEDGTGMKTKGSYRRTVWVSRHLMGDLHHYAAHWRGERSHKSAGTYAPLFLNQDGRPWSSDGKGIEAFVRRLGRKIGLHISPHILRHTYATHTLLALQRQRDQNRLEPVIFLMRQLGHTSIATTQRYLHLINDLADHAVLAFDEELYSLAAQAHKDA